MLHSNDLCLLMSDHSARVPYSDLYEILCITAYPGPLHVASAHAHNRAAGKITGDIRVNGHAWEVATFARVSGYVEQFDVHSPTATVREAVLFSARMRFPRGVDVETMEAFTDEVHCPVHIAWIMPASRDVQAQGAARLLVLLSLALSLLSGPPAISRQEPLTADH